MLSNATNEIAWDTVLDRCIVDQKGIGRNGAYTYVFHRMTINRIDHLLHRRMTPPGVIAF
jgi:hypothetical protein